MFQLPARQVSFVLRAKSGYWDLRVVTYYGRTVRDRSEQLYEGLTTQESMDVMCAHGDGVRPSKTDY